MENHSFILAVVFVVVPLAGFAIRAYILTLIKEGVRAPVEAKLERLKSELRQTEDVMRSSLQRYEGEMTSLRSGVLEGRAQRQAKISSRRIDCLENLWLNFQTLGKFKILIAAYRVFNIEEVEKRIELDEKLQNVISNIVGNGFDNIIDETKLGSERIYVTEMVWATYSAYSSIIVAIYMHMKALSLGISDGSKFVAWDKMGELAKAVLPHQADFIDKHGSTSLSYLLDEIETKMLDDVKAALNGEEDDERALAQSSAIMDRVKALSSESRAIETDVSGKSTVR